MERRMKEADIEIKAQKKVNKKLGIVAKKDSYLLTETAKADREKETQGRLMIIERGLREMAEAEAIANVAKVTAVIAAELKYEVAKQDKLAAETTAAAKFSVAEIAKQESLIIASAKFEVAEISAKQADQERIAMILRAQGRKEAIELSGDITELEQAQINAKVDIATAVANALAKINVPQTMIIGASGEGNGSSIMEHLINLKLMVDTGILDKTSVDGSAVDRKITR